MAIKILKEGSTTPKKFHVICDNCKAELSYDSNDLIQVGIEGYKREGIVCPCCKDSIYHDPNNEEKSRVH